MINVNKSVIIITELQQKRVTKMKKVLSTMIVMSMLVSMYASPVCAKAADATTEYILGDVDRSGVVTAADAKKVRSLIKIGEVG